MKIFKVIFPRRSKFIIYESLAPVLFNFTMVFKSYATEETSDFTI